MSMYHAGIVIADILGEEHHAAEYHAVPRVTFTDPEIGSVGLTEAQAREQGWMSGPGYQRRSRLRRAAGSTRRATRASSSSCRTSRGGVLVGATSAGPVGGEVLSMLTLAVHARVPVQRLREMIYAYPTFHRAVEPALADLA